jgi:hypothetical protein
MIAATHSVVILRSRALARRLEGWPQALVAHPSRLAEDGEHLRMTAALVWRERGAPAGRTVIASQRVGAKRRPMTGSAKQPRAAHAEGLDCFVASLLAMTWVTP